jgi:toxin ParE1/3/4
MKRLIMQRRALRDLVDARAYYQKEAPHVVGDFALTVDAELRHLRENAGTGSPRYGRLIGMPGLRSWPVKRFPYVIFYVDQADHITVVRVLHQASDIPRHLDN